MAEIILHHYDISPYAEKIRLALGLKGLPWRSVHIPIVMPKPHLTTLTGGYRRTPTLQLGADLYCDTKVIARALEGLHPNPSLYPVGCDAILPALSRWAETSFMMVVTLMFGLGGVFEEDFVEDRKKMLPGVDFSQARHLVPAKRLQLAAQLDLLERQLAQRGPFLLGDSPSLADLAAYHPLLPVRLHPDLQSLLEPVAAVRAWMDRVAGIGHGKPEELEPEQAVAIARDASPARRSCVPGSRGRAPRGGGVGKRDGPAVAFGPARDPHPTRERPGRRAGRSLPARGLSGDPGGIGEEGQVRSQEGPPSTSRACSVA
jgi:glutathione S-transferase